MTLEVAAHPMHTQLRAGFLAEAVRDHFADHSTSLGEDVINHLTAFDLSVEGPVEPFSVDDPILAVAENLITRGIPTLPSLRVETALARATDLTEERRVKGSISFPFSDEMGADEKRLLRYSLLPIDPSISPADVATGLEPRLDSDEEKDFLQGGAPEAIGEWACQLIEPQRPLDTIVPEEQALDFSRQNVDFASQLPVASGSDGGLVVEIDGKHHEEAGQIRLDKKRDRACDSAGWTYERIEAKNAASPPLETRSRLRDAFDHPCGQILRENYEAPFWKTDREPADGSSEPPGDAGDSSADGGPPVQWMHMALIPMQVARIQKTLLRLLRRGQLDLNARSWTIAIAERDVPGARLAVADFLDLMENLLLLKGEGRTIPNVNLCVYRSPIHRELELGDRNRADRDDNRRLSSGDGRSSDPFGFDAYLTEDPSEMAPMDAEVVIDTSVLLRPGLEPLSSGQVDRLGSRAVQATIRTAHAPTTWSYVQKGTPTRYDVPEPLGDQIAGDEQAKEHPQLRPLLYFLRNVFRKESYRPNQVDILSESLRGKDVIGLLPTGAGKSLTYQLSALLQPGVSVVVAPLKSLMHDQFANLRQAGIGSVRYIDSSLGTQERQRVQREMREGRFQFVFVSPERLQIQKFRDHLQSMEVPITYCVVDEAHCVSEWGHDFRTAYLRLGANAREHCSTEWPNLPIIALTGTASFDVLADVRRELEFGEETNTVTPATMEREELVFDIVHVPSPEVDSDDDPWEIRKSVFQQKKQVLPEVVREIPNRLDPQVEDKAHKEVSRESIRRPSTGGRGVSGPSQPSGGPAPDSPTAERHGDPDPDTDESRSGATDGEPGQTEVFFAPDGPHTNSGLVFTPHANGDLGVQELSNRLRSGVHPLRGEVGTFASSDDEQSEEQLSETQEAFKANDLSALVATKAFGMGIDKPNIRYVVHMNMAQSIESYYQQAGRAGRDGDPARCVILYCDQEIPSQEASGENDEDVDAASPTVTVDRELLLYFHRNSFKGPEKEKRIVYDLLTGDARPEGESPDIQALVRDMEVGDAPQTVAIDFDNRELLKEVSEYLRSNADRGFTRRVVSKAFRKARSEDGLTKKLKWAYNQTHDEWPAWECLEGHERWLQTWFKRLRDEQDTFRAVYRLSTVGVIRDYTVDYNAGVIRAEIQNLGDDGFIASLQEYIGRYVAPERIREIPDGVRDHRGQTVLQKCIGYLIDFVYRLIARKRKAAVQVMEDAVREGIREGNGAFRQRVNTYFDSRYLLPLQRRVEDRTFTLDLIWDFIDETEGIDDNVNHLRGACDRLLSEYTENGALYLLRAYTRCLLDGGQHTEFRSDLREGWRLFRDIKDLSWPEYLQALSTYRDQLAQYDNRLQGVLDEEIARVHAQWLQKFNERFVGDLAEQEPRPV